MTCEHGCCEYGPDCVHHGPFGPLPSHACGACGQNDCDMTGPGHFEGDDEGDPTTALGGTRDGC